MPNKIVVGVCDDEKEILNIISSSISSSFQSRNIETEVLTYHNPLFLKDDLQTKGFSLIFLDIDMPELSGIELAKYINETTHDIDFIFVSNREDLVFDSLKTRPFGFVRKSAFLSDITPIIDIYIKTKFHHEDSGIFVKTKEGRVNLPLNEITYIEAIGKTQFIHLKSKDSVEIHSSLNNIEETLKDKNFIRISKGFMIGLRHVKAINCEEVLLSTGEKLPISKLYSKDVRKKYMNYLQSLETLII